MKNITMAIAGFGLLLIGSAQAATVGNFGPYAQANSNHAATTGTQVSIPAEGRLNAYAPAAQAPKSAAELATSSEGHFSAYHS